MTKKEALRAVVNYPLPDLAFEKALIDAGLVAADTYALSDQQAIELCAAELLLIILTSPSEGEGSFRVTPASREVLRERRSFILEKYGKEDTLKPSVKSGNWW